MQLEEVVDQRNDLEQDFEAVKLERDALASQVGELATGKAGDTWGEDSAGELRWVAPDEALTEAREEIERLRNELNKELASNTWLKRQADQNRQSAFESKRELDRLHAVGGLTQAATEIDRLKLIESGLRERLSEMTGLRDSMREGYRKRLESIRSQLTQFLDQTGWTEHKDYIQGGTFVYLTNGGLSTQEQGLMQFRDLESLRNSLQMEAQAQS